MAHKTPKLVSMKIADLIQIDGENVRYSIAELESLVIDIRDNWKKWGLIHNLKGSGGLSEAITVEKMDDGLHTRKGHKRTKALRILQERYPKGFQPEGSNDIFVFDEVQAIVFEGLNNLERFLLTFDQGNREGLSAASVFNVMVKAWDEGMTEKDSVNMARTAIDNTSPLPTDATLKMNTAIAGGSPPDRAYLEARKGWIDGRKRAYHCPLVLREAFFKRLDKQQNWPSDPEVKLAYSHHMMDFEIDKMNVTKSKPGPLFTKYWTDLVASKVNAIVEGNKPKSKSMVGPKDMLAMHQNVESPLTRLFTGIALAEVDRSAIKALDEMNKIVVEIATNHETFTPEILKVNLGLLTAAVKKAASFLNVKPS